MNELNEFDINRLAMENCFMWDEQTIKELEKNECQSALQEMDMNDMNILEYHTILALHPSYLKVFNQVNDYLFYGTQNIPLRWKYQIALLCCSQCNNDYLLATYLHISGFDMSDPIDTAIQELLPLIEILAKHPYTMNSHIIDIYIDKHHWSISDIIQIICLCCHIICLSSFCFSVGLNINTSLINISNNSNQSINIVHYNSSEKDREERLYTELEAHEILLENELNHTEDSSISNQYISSIHDNSIHDNSIHDNSISSTNHNLSNTISITQDEKNQISLDSSQTCMNEPLIIDTKKKNKDNKRISTNIRLDSSYPISSLSQHYSLYNQSSSDSLTISDTLMDKNEKINSSKEDTVNVSLETHTIKPIRIDFMNTSYLLFSTYSWDTNAYPLIYHYIPDYARLQELLFTHIYNLTYHTFSTLNNVDTSLYRETIWNYTQRTLGILHNETDFSVICKQLYSTSMLFIQYITEGPYIITKKDFDQLSSKLSNSERCHFIIIVIEAYRQALLLYGMRAVSNYLELSQ